MTRLDKLAIIAARLGHVVIYVPPTPERPYTLLTDRDPRGVK